MFASLVVNELEEGLDYQHVFMQGLWGKDGNNTIVHKFVFIVRRRSSQSAPKYSLYHGKNLPQQIIKVMTPLNFVPKNCVSHKFQYCIDT